MLCRNACASHRGLASSRTAAALPRGRQDGRKCSARWRAKNKIERRGIVQVCGEEPIRSCRWVPRSVPFRHLEDVQPAPTDDRNYTPNKTRSDRFCSPGLQPLRYPRWSPLKIPEPEARAPEDMRDRLLAFPSFLFILLYFIFFFFDFLVSLISPRNVRIGSRYFADRAAEAAAGEEDATGSALRRRHFRKRHGRRISVRGTPWIPETGLRKRENGRAIYKSRN